MRVRGWGRVGGRVDPGCRACWGSWIGVVAAKSMSSWLCGC
jgi:hypothetical protein